MKKWSLPRLAVQRKRGYYAALFGIVVLGIVLSMTWAFGAFHPIPKAHAGTNGQQLQIDTRAASIEVLGTNQDGNFVYSPCLKGDTSKNFDTINLQGWWWKGDVEIRTWPVSDMCRGGTYSGRIYSVPTLSDSDWFYIDNL